MTILYLMRHSEPFKPHRGIEEVAEDILFANIKTPLSIKGEKISEKLSKSSEFDNLDTVWSSDYVRCMSTAKYFAEKNNLKVNISNKLGEIKHGVSKCEDLPLDFEIHQLEDENYKIGKGESRKETRERLLEKILFLLKEHKDQRLLVVGHSTAFAYLLDNWCTISYDSDYKFKDNIFFDGKWNYCETFKLIFDDQLNLIDIENLKNCLED